MTGLPLSQLKSFSDVLRPDISFTGSSLLQIWSPVLPPGE